VERAFFSAITHGGIVHVVPGFVPAAVAAHCFFSCNCEFNGSAV
jgi:hypothetical protein